MRCKRFNTSSGLEGLETDGALEPPDVPSPRTFAAGDAGRLSLVMTAADCEACFSRRYWRAMSPSDGELEFESCSVDETEGVAAFCAGLEEELEFDALEDAEFDAVELEFVEVDDWANVGTHTPVITARNRVSFRGMIVLRRGIARPFQLFAQIEALKGDGPIVLTCRSRNLCVTAQGID